MDAPTEPQFEIRAGNRGDDDFIAAAFRNMWLDIGVGAENLVADAEDRTVQFIENARANLDFRSFVAEVEGEPVGGAACQEFAGLYPNVLAAKHRRYGYIWGVYVEAAHRRRGLGEALASRCVAELKKAEYSHAVLHAAPMGEGVYKGLGFLPTTEMRLEF
ncbi:MAG: GNAT family N-acetyltransferase [Nannocystales bacterium]